MTGASLQTDHSSKEIKLRSTAFGSVFVGQRDKNFRLTWSAATVDVSTVCKSGECPSCD